MSSNLKLYLKYYKTGGSKTYISKKFYTKRTYITLLSEKFGGSGAPPGPFKATPMGVVPPDQRDVRLPLLTSYQI
ncbi:hypothetical protein Hanom_Chr08g00714851 [Helianthus anomalus]